MDLRGLAQDPGVLTLQDDDDLQIFSAERLGGELIEGAPSLDGVADDQRRDQEDAIAPQGVLHLNIQLGHWDHLAFHRHGPSDHLEGKPQPSWRPGHVWNCGSVCSRVDLSSPHLQLDRSRDDHAFPQVSNSEHEGGAAISWRDDGVPGEDECLGAAVGLRRLHEYAAEHHGVDDQPQDILDDQHRDGQGALLCHHPAAKPDGHLKQVAV